jgi:RNA methyltransferase, TrmH family
MISKAQIKLIRSLEQKKHRNKNKLFVVEGRKSIIETIASQRFVVKNLYLLPKAVRELQQTIREVPLYTEVSETELNKISCLSTPDFGVALLHISEENLIYNLQEQPIQLVLDGIRDPGNLGTIIRLCDWFGVRQILCSHDTTDCFSPKVIQSTMGSFSRVNVCYVELKDSLCGLSDNTSVFGLNLRGKPIHQITPKSPLYLVVGSESNGISKEVQNLLTAHITIQRDQSSQTESLNAAMATSIALYHFTMPSL